MQYSVQPGRSTKNDAHAHLLSFPKLHTTQFIKCSFRNTTHFKQKYGLQHDIPIPKGVTPFSRPASSWKHAFPGTPGIHTIELIVHNQNTHHKLTIYT